MNPTFLGQNKPFVTSMILKPTPEAVCFAVRESCSAGADALGIQLERIRREYRTEENYRAMFRCCAGRPIYITSYRYCENSGMTDEACAEDLLTGLRCGATLADIPADLFDRGAPCELSEKPDAVKRQTELAEQMHKMGREVLFSSHVQKFIPAEEVLRVALSQQERGADIVKIVCAGNSDAEQMENLRITTLLREKLRVPFLFLSGGTHAKIHRMIGPMLGCVMFLATLERDAASVPTQPTVRAARAVLQNFDYAPEILINEGETL